MLLLLWPKFVKERKVKTTPGNIGSTFLSSVTGTSRVVDPDSLCGSGSGLTTRIQSLNILISRSAGSVGFGFQDPDPDP
jgi:hypothetical protein